MTNYIKEEAMKNSDPHEMHLDLGSLGQVEGKTEGSRGGGELHGNSVFHTQQGSSTHELALLITACTRSPQAQARQQSKHGAGRWGKHHEIPLLTQ